MRQLLVADRAGRTPRRWWQILKLANWRQRRLLALAPVLVGMLPATRVCAQAVSASDAVVAKADEYLAAGDTAKALAVLEAALSPRSTHAAVWHRYGQLKWQRAAQARRGGFIRDAHVIAGLRAADSALRLATQLAPDNAIYWITLGRFNLESGVGSMRLSAAQQMERAFTAASRVADSTLMAESADELGLATWRRYETTANRAQVGAGQRVQLQTSGRWQRGRAKDYLATFANKIDPPTGKADFDEALARFRVASDVAPSQLRYSRHVYMALATGRRWDELLAVGTRRAQVSAFDAQARFARGVALHRLRRPRESSAAFDSALAMMDDAERQDLVRLDRLLPPGASVLTGASGLDTAAFRALPLAQREATSRLYWALNDPLGETVENESRLEYIARVIEADWRWTDHVMGLRGADTDRGDVLIRYGPPDEELTLPGTASVQQQVFEMDPAKGGVLAGGMTSTSQDGGVTLAWVYRSGDVFFFDLAPGFGTARTPLTDQQFVRDVATMKPVTWDNLGGPQRVDSLGLRLTRFRATGDSTDVVIGTRLPLQSLAAPSSSSDRAAEGAAAELRVDLRLIDGGGRVFGVDTTRSRARSDSGTDGAYRSWVRRVGKGTTFVRVEAVNTGARRMANALAAIESEGARGFGLSDVLLVSGAGVAPVGDARGWRELNVTPSSGAYRAGEKVGLVWETYELAPGADANRYRVTISLERLKRTGASGLALRVLDGVGTLLQQERGGADKLTMSFERNVAARATQVDYLTLDWLGDARGEYRLRLEVTDRQTNRTSARETRFRIQ